MKRFGLFALTIIFLMSVLSGCVYIPLFERFEIDPATVESIEIYDLRQCKSTFGGDFLETETPVYQIPAEQVDDFLADLADIQFTDAVVIIFPAVMDPSFYYDAWTVRINYTNGNYELISCDHFGQTFDKNGEKIDTHHWGCDSDKWWALIGKYVPKDIFENWCDETI